MAANLSEYYKNLGKALPKTAEERFADPSFATAAKTAGYDMNSYKVNAGNAKANQDILAQLSKSTSGAVQGGTVGAVDTSKTLGENLGTTPVTANINYGTENPFYADYENSLKTAASAPLDESTIRANTLDRYRDQINATDQIYNQLLTKARQTGAENTGAGTAIIAARGLAGSGRGMGIASNITNAELEQEKSIQAERATKIASIMAGANDEAAQEIARAREAKAKGAADYITFLKGKEDRKSEAVSGVAGQLLAQGIDIANLNPKQLTEIATKLGTDTGTIINAYTGLKNAKTKAQADISKIEADIAKGKLVEVNEGNALYNVETGEVFKNPKTYAPKATGTGGSGGGTSGGGTYKNDLDALVGNTYNLIASKNGKDAFSNTISNARNEADKINAIASVVLKNSPAELRTDFTNQSAGIRNIDKAIKLIDEGTKTGVLNNAGQYVFNVFGRDFDPKLAAINSYITGAIQPYRNSVTGAAWGDQEEAEYQSLFGSTKYSPTELKNRLTRIKEIMADKSANALQAQVNPLSEYNPFIQGGASDSVRIQKPDGTTGTIPRANLEKALSLGAKVIQ